MARRKTVTTVEADENDEELLLAPADLSDPEEKAEQDIVDELKKLGGDDGVKWSVHKIAGKPGERGGWCADYSTAELSLQGIRETFGGGRYRIQGTKIAGGQWVAKRTIEIMDTPKPDNHANGAASGGIDVAALAAALKPGDSGMMPILLEMIKSNTAQMTALFQGMNNRPAEKQTSAMELVTLIKALQPEKSDEKSAVELLMEGLRLGRELGGGGGGSDWMDLARTGLEAIKPAIEAQAAARSATPPALPAPAAPALAGPAPAPAAAPAPQPGADPMLQQLSWLRAQLNTLVFQAAKNAAGKGGDPELYADIVLDNLPPFVTPEALFERISAPDALTQLAQIDARVNQHLQWFTIFRQAIIDSFVDEGDEPGGDDEPPGAAAPI